MLFMNIARKFGNVFQEEAGTETGSPTTAAPTGEPAKTAVTEPAETVVEEKTPAAVEPEDNGMGQYIEQHSADNPALGLALTFLRDAGIAPTDPAFTMAEVDGDFTLLKAMLAQKALPGTDAMVAILEKAVSDHQASVEEHEAKTTALVAEVLGEQQEAILGWARENASDEEKSVINEMLEAGGLYARAAAVMLREQYSGSGQTIPATNPVQFSQSGGGTASGPLDARTYAAEVQALATKLGGDPRSSREYQVLSQRREAGRKRGI